MIEQCGPEGTLDLSVGNDRLVISPGSRQRQGWSHAFRAAGPAENDELLSEPMPATEFDRKQ
jgi:hypothetical protein